VPGFIPPEIVDQVRDANDIVEVIGGYVTLKLGPKSASYKGLSPFNREKSPSFFVHTEKRIFKCFSSGHGGDVIKFIMLMDGLSFPEAVRRLAARASIIIPEEDSAGGRERRRSEATLGLLSAVTRFWHQILMNVASPIAAGARDHLAYEGLLGMEKDFMMGFAPSDEDMVTWAQVQHHDMALLRSMGLIGPRSFAGRLIVPIHDHMGQVVAFTGQMLAPSPGQPRYRCSPDSPYFVRERVLFGLYRNKAAIIAAGVVVLCPSPADLIRCARHLIFNVLVAPRATPLGDLQVRALRRLAGKALFLSVGPTTPVIEASCAALRAEGVEVEVLTLPTSLDAMLQDDLDGLRSLLEKASQLDRF
jgi:DNA primase